MNLGSFILNLFAWGFVLGVVGSLPQMTRYFKEEAVKTHKTGLMNLGTWSRKLEKVK